MTISLTEKSLSDRHLCINKLDDKQKDFLDLSVILEICKEIWRVLQRALEGFIELQRSS